MSNKPESETVGSPAVWLFGATVFASAFLLFQVQPIIGKFILPWYGGTPAVWTTCMLVFQVLLLVGYFYAHILTRYFRPSTQVLVHAVLILISLLVLPITPSEQLKPGIASEPTISILWLLLMTIGMPYLLLSATGPLLQQWFSRCSPEKTPYRLYALSNTGSLLALVSYPFVVEPLIGRLSQTIFWSWLMVVFAILCLGCAIVVSKNHTWSKGSFANSALAESVKSPRRVYLFWLAFPAIASVELLAVTSKITQDIAAIPFLWVLPLSIYLLTFIICFDSPRWYKHGFFLVLFIFMILVSVFVRLAGEDVGIISQIIVYSVLLFACAMLCHGQLYHLRPDARYLTSYYLMISAGGALGGFFVAIVAPLVFQSYLELNLGLLGCILLTLMADINGNIPQARRNIWVIVLSFVGVLIIIFGKPVGVSNRILLESSRNFFGVLTLWRADIDKPGLEKNILQHGTTFHGIQFIDPARQSWPTAYYGKSSGVGLAFELLADKPDLRIGGVGLGVGTVATYARAGDNLTFYEINPAVRDIAQDATKFSYLANCPAEYEILIGDARLVMDQQAGQGFDLLIVDAFSSDSVPVHLLTVEAMNVYLKHIADDGIIAFHLSNNHLKLPELVMALAEYCGLTACWIEDDGDEQVGTLTSSWVLLANTSERFENKKIITRSRKHFDKSIKPWTDDHVNLLEILK